MKDLILQNKRLFLQFLRINRVAALVYNAMQGGIPMNFYKCYCEYNDGIFGWLKEYTAFNAAIEIHEEYTANEVWDDIAELEDTFGDYLRNVTPEEMQDLYNELINEK